MASVGRTITRLCSDGGAAACDQGGVAPASAVAADAFPGPDDAESGCCAEGDAGGVFREEAGLDGPDPGCFGGRDQGVQELPADAVAACLAVDVDRMLDHSPVDRAGRYRQGRDPSDHGGGVERSEE